MKGEARVVGEGTMRQQRGGWGNNGVGGGRGGGPYALLCRRGVERFGVGVGGRVLGFGLGWGFGAKGVCLL